jgi:hypothetical protein
MVRCGGDVDARKMCRCYLRRNPNDRQHTDYTGHDFWLTKRTETTIEAHQYFVVRGPEKPVLAWCADCAAETMMVGPEMVAILCSVTTLTVLPLGRSRIGSLRKDIRRRAVRLLYFASWARRKNGGAKVN